MRFAHHRRVRTGIGARGASYGLPFIAGWVGIAVFSAWMLRISWMRWMEVLVDFGREVYLPWRVTEGEHLGRDYVHPYGPLSVYLNAGLFEVFGVSIRTLPDGTQIITTPDGGRFMIGKDGTRTVLSPARPRRRPTPEP